MKSDSRADTSTASPGDASTVRSTPARRIGRVALAVALLLLVACGVVLAMQMLYDPGSDIRSEAVSDPAQQRARGAYLSLAGNCMGCHTARGGAAFAGGRRLATPFGDLYAPNITPDDATGIGRWSADDFWRALHNGKSKDGRFLYPAFPYTEYTRISRADADAMYAYFRSVPAVSSRNRAQALAFPYDQRILLAAWRALYFRPGVYRTDPQRTAQWNRGAYLVQGLGHCAACHSVRNDLGATERSVGLGGGLIPMLDWYAPALDSNRETGLGSWQEQEIVDLLHGGVSARGAVFGPMAEVVRESLQHLSAQDVGAMAVYLKSLPQGEDEQSGLSGPAAGRAAIPSTRSATAKTAGSDAAPVQDDALAERDAFLGRGLRIYHDRCASCHRADGRGMTGAYPPLAGNPAVTMASSVNAIRMVLNGGFAPSTQANPRPYGMPPFGPLLADDDVAAVVSYMRAAWGNHAAPVDAPEVARYRTVPGD